MASAAPFLSQQDQREHPEHAARDRRAFVRVVLALAPLLLIEPRLDLRSQSTVGHVWSVTGAALIAIGLALQLLWVALVRHDGRVLPLGSGFLALALLFLFTVALPLVPANQPARG